MTPEAKAETKTIIKTVSVALGCILGMMIASLWFIPFAYEAYENDTISMEVYYIIWSLPIVNIGVVLIGTGIYMYRTSDEDEAKPIKAIRPKDSI